MSEETGRKIMVLLEQNGSLDSVFEIYKNMPNLLKETILAMIPVNEFRLRKWSRVKEVSNAELRIIVAEYLKDSAYDQLIMLKRIINELQ